MFDFSQAVDVFKTVQENPVLLAAFTDYAVKNWSVENVLFYKETEIFRDTFEAMNPESRREKAEAIMNEFVAIGSPLEINIEHTARTSLVKKIKEGNVTVEIFKVAQKHVYELMKKDSFDKWQKTTEYRLAVEKAMAKRSTSRSQDRAASTTGGGGGSAIFFE